MKNVPMCNGTLSCVWYIVKVHKNLHKYYAQGGSREL
jgi:hypothetical protein